MMVRPELISANSAPDASPLNNCETKLGQVIIWESGRGTWRTEIGVRGAGGDGCPRAARRFPYV